MDLQPSRRTILLGATGSVLALASGPAARAAAVAAPLPVARPVGLPGPAEGMARLFANENPYGPAPSAIAMMDEAARRGAYYTGDATKILAGMIADRHGLMAENVVLTTGSAEALSAVAMIHAGKGPIVIPDLIFDPTILYAVRQRAAQVQRVPMTAGLGIDLPAMEAAVTDSTGMVQLCNPNNPTGLLMPSGALRDSVRRMAQKTKVVVDEAYIELVDDPEGNSCVSLVREGLDVIVSRTFSKLYGMAGVRVGYTLSSAETAASIRAASMSWMSSIGLAGAIGCYNDAAFINQSKAKITQARQMIQAATSALGLETLPSQVNFLFFRSGRGADALRDALAAQGVQIRGAYSGYGDWSRVSCGLLEDVQRFCDALPAALA